MEVGLGPGDIELNRDHAPPQKGWGHSTPHIGPCLLCQTIGSIKVKFGMEVGLVPGHIVLDGDPAPPPKKGHSPHFRLMFIVAKWLDG